jgi:hypothetical protein
VGGEKQRQHIGSQHVVAGWLADAVCGRPCDHQGPTPAPTPTSLGKQVNAWIALVVVVVILAATLLLLGQKGSRRRLGSGVQLSRAWLRTKQGRDLVEWALFSFAPVVVVPLTIFAVSLLANDQSVGLQTLGGRGDFAFMGVALAATAQASVRRFAPVPPDSTAHPIVGFVMVALLLSAGVWGMAAGQTLKVTSSTDGVPTAEPEHALLFAVLGLIILGFCTLVAASAACLDPRLDPPPTPVVVDRGIDPLTPESAPR